jgi:hypothetical protein
MRTALLSLALLCSPALAQVGFYTLASPRGVARTTGEMCIERGALGSFSVRLFGSYCPSVGNDCANARFDSKEFETEQHAGALTYRDQHCTFNVQAGKKGATVTQTGHCSDYDLFAGRYVKRAAEVWTDDCSPVGDGATHHR